MHDPLAGLTGGATNDESPFEDAAVVDYNHNHEKHGYFSSGGFTSGGKSSKIKKTKYAPSPRRDPGGIDVGSRRYAKLCGIMNSRYPGLKEGEIRTIRDSKKQYIVRSDGYGGMKVLKSWDLY